MFCQSLPFFIVGQLLLSHSSFFPFPFLYSSLQTSLLTAFSFPFLSFPVASFFAEDRNSSTMNVGIDKTLEDKMQVRIWEEERGPDQWREDP